MGIPDLVNWAKKAHPSAFKSFPKRWASPEIRGKKIAIDATLLTNRFHFAVTDGPLKGKGGILGWFGLINAMRSHGVQPIAIWDKPGHRPWKEPETRRRVYVRAQNLARRAHEDEREERLGSLRSAIMEFQRLSLDEQSVVKQHWQATRFVDISDSGDIASLPLPNTSPTSSPSTPPSSSSLSSIDTAKVNEIQDVPSFKRRGITTPLDSTSESIERITSTIDTWYQLIRRYRSHTRFSPPIGPSDPTIAHIRDLEDLNEELGEPISPTVPSETPFAIGTSPNSDALGSTELRDEVRDFLDRQIQETLEPHEFPESRTQRVLTQEEGEIINTLFGTPPVLSPSSETTPSPETVDTTMETTLDPEERLAQLIEKVPTVRQIYERALNQPLPIHHAECRELLSKMGVPIIHAEAPYEAEGMAAAMAKTGIVDFVATEDSDVIAYEAPLLKNVTAGKWPLQLISPETIISETLLSKSSFLDFCILLGTDASPRIPKIGPSSAFKLITKYQSIENIMKENPSIEERVKEMECGLEGWWEMVRNSRKMFGELPDVTGVSLDQGEYDLREVERWLEERHGISFVDEDALEEGKIQEINDDIVEEGLGRVVGIAEGASELEQQMDEMTIFEESSIEEHSQEEVGGALSHDEEESIQRDLGSELQKR